MLDSQSPCLSTTRQQAQLPENIALMKNRRAAIHTKTTSLQRRRGRCASAARLSTNYPHPHRVTWVLRERSRLRRGVGRHSRGHARAMLVETRHERRRMTGPAASGWRPSVLSQYYLAHGNHTPPSTSSRVRGISQNPRGVCAGPRTARDRLRVGTLDQVQQFAFACQRDRQ